jgi:hypothetical protein
MEGAMSMLPVFLMSIARVSPPAEPGARTMSIVIRRPYAYLEKELLSTFKGQKDVQVVVDRRRGERRMKIKSVEQDRRLSDRRGVKEEIVEVVL